MVGSSVRSSKKKCGGWRGESAMVFKQSISCSPYSLKKKQRNCWRSSSHVTVMWQSPMLCIKTTLFLYHSHGENHCWRCDYKYKCLWLAKIEIRDGYWSGIDGDDFSPSSSYHQHTLKTLCKNIQKLHIWNPQGQGASKLENSFLGHK